MYIKVKNISLDKILEEYGVKRIEQLDDEQLISLCKKLNVSEVWIMSKEQEVNQRRREGLDRVKVVENILRSNTYDDYMGSMNWGIEHDKLDAKYKIRESLRTHMEGDETFKLFESMKMGFYRLKPGEERELDVTKDWIEDNFLNSALATYGEKGQMPKILVFDEDGNVLNKGYKPQPKKEEEAKEIDWDNLDWQAILSMAKGYKIRTNRLKRPVLVDMLKERLKLDNKIK